MIDRAPQHPAPSLSTHLSCASCSYDLHGLTGEGKCPECGWPIAHTLAAGYHDRSWLIAIRSGVQALLVGHYVLLGSAILCPLLPLGICFFIILILAGTIELGTRHPLAPPDDTSGDHPVYLLGAVLVACVLGIMLRAIPLLAISMLGLGAACLGAGLSLLWRRFATIMARDLSREAARLGRDLAWLAAAASALLVLATVLQALHLVGMANSGAASLTAAVAGLAWLANIVTATIALSIGREALKRALRAVEAVRGPAVEPPPVVVR